MSIESHNISVVPTFDIFLKNDLSTLFVSYINGGKEDTYYLYLEIVLVDGDTPL